MQRSHMPAILLAIILILTWCSPPAHGQALPESGREDPELVSVFTEIFHDYYPDLPCRSAAWVLNSKGIVINYIQSPLNYYKGPAPKTDYPWRDKRLATRLNRQLPTTGNAREMMALAGLRMREVLDAEKLLGEGRRPEAIALLTRYLEPKMDRTNKKIIQGYDPNLCCNDTRDHVFDLGIASRDLDWVRRQQKHFHLGRHEKYREELHSKLEKFPRLSMLHVGIGNSHFAEGDLAQAQQWYRQAARANPLDPMPAYGMAFCHLVEGRHEQAIAALIESVLNCRNNMMSWLLLETLLTGEGGRVADMRFQQKAVVGQAGFVNLEKILGPRMLTPWLYYAAADIATLNPRTAPWQGFDKWDLEPVELYKIAHLMGSYLYLQQKDESLHDSYIQKLLGIHRRGYLKEYVLFEKIAPYVDYHRVAMLPPAEKARMRDYLKRFVLIKGGRPSR